MEKVKAGLRGLSAEEKVVRGRAVLGALTDNPHFPGMAALLTDLQTAMEELNTANIDALDRGRKACARKQSAVEVFDRTLSRVAAHVNAVASGDTGKLVTTGFPMAKRPEPRNALDAPNIIGFRMTQWEGRVDMRWTSVRGALVYLVEACEDLDAPRPAWGTVAITSKLNHRVERTLGGRSLAYRVQAIGNRLQGPSSLAKCATAA